MTFPLPDAGAACVSQHNTANLVKRIEQTVFFNRIANQFTTGGNGKLGPGL
jgi:hypothetical protein